MVGSCFIWEPSPIHTGGAPAEKLAQEFRLFLYFSVLPFTSETSSDNALARVSKSRTGGFQRLVGTVGTKPVVFVLEYSAC
jgi:hypothetical protein